MTTQTQTPKATTRRPGQRRTTAEKVSDGKARRDAQQAKAATKGICRAGHGRYGFPEKMADCTSKVYVTEAGNAKQLCLAHEREYAQRTRARKAAEKAQAKDTTKRAAKKSNVVKLPTAVAVDQPVPAEALAAFASVELAEKAVAKRRASKAPAKS